MRESAARSLPILLLAALLALAPAGRLLAQAAPEEVPPTTGILATYSEFMFAFNRGFYHLLDSWKTSLFGTPEPAYTAPPVSGETGGLGNVAVNLVNEPITFVSGLLIGDWTTAWVALQRFGINATAGILGWYDTASAWGYTRRELDFGLVLCAYGLDSGPYLVLPFIGPRTARDAFTDVIVTNAVLWTTMWMLLDTSSGLLAIAAAEAVEVVAEVAATRQIDSRASTIKFADYDLMRDQYLRQRVARCNQVRAHGGAPVVN